jgi:hypothetical protein
MEVKPIGLKPNLIFFCLFVSTSSSLTKRRKWEGGSGMRHVQRGEMLAGVWLRNVKGRDHMNDLVVDARVILKFFLK